ncbi:hypothetical protein HDU96_004725 [Phlyctochytrium bullatum]|nr:hypothetical protein HDU96_004725 [Phlyctochytrium bullatum]
MSGDRDTRYTTDSYMDRRADGPEQQRQTDAYYDDGYRRTDHDNYYNGGRGGGGGGGYDQDRLAPPSAHYDRDRSRSPTRSDADNGYYRREDRSPAPRSPYERDRPSYDKPRSPYEDSRPSPREPVPPEKDDDRYYDDRSTWNGGAAGTDSYYAPNTDSAYYPPRSPSPYRDAGARSPAPPVAAVTSDRSDGYSSVGVLGVHDDDRYFDDQRSTDKLLPPAPLSLPPPMPEQKQSNNMASGRPSRRHTALSVFGAEKLSQLGTTIKQTATKAVTFKGEAEDPKSPKEQQDADVERDGGKRRCRVCPTRPLHRIICISSLLMFAIVIIVLGVLFWPRFPTIKVLSVQVDDGPLGSSPVTFSLPPGSANLNNITVRFSLKLNISCVNSNLYRFKLDSIDLDTFLSVNTTAIAQEPSPQTLGSLALLVPRVTPDPNYKANLNPKVGSGNRTTIDFPPGKNVTFLMNLVVEYRPDPNLGLLKDPAFAELLGVCGVLSNKPRPAKISYVTTTRVNLLTKFGYTPTISDQIFINCPVNPDDLVALIQGQFNTAGQPSTGGRTPTSTGATTGGTSGTGGSAGAAKSPSPRPSTRPQSPAAPAFSNVVRPPSSSNNGLPSGGIGGLTTVPGSGGTAPGTSGGVGGLTRGNGAAAVVPPSLVDAAGGEGEGSGYASPLATWIQAGASAGQKQAVAAAVEEEEQSSPAEVVEMLNAAFSVGRTGMRDITAL